MRALLCLPLAMYLLGAGCANSTDAYLREPSTARLTLTEGTPHATRVGEQRRVFAQLIVDPGLHCDDGFEGTTCNDPGPGPSSEFQVVEASCDDGTCTVLGVNATLGFLVELTVLPRAPSAVLRVRARTGQGDGAVEARSEYRLQCEPE